MSTDQDDVLQEGHAVATLGPNDGGDLVEGDLIVRASADPGDQFLRDVGAGRARGEREHVPSVR